MVSGRRSGVVQNPMKLREIMRADAPTASVEETATAAWDRMRALRWLSITTRPIGAGRAAMSTP